MGAAGVPVIGVGEVPTAPGACVGSGALGELDEPALDEPSVGAALAPLVAPADDAVPVAPPAAGDAPDAPPAEVPLAPAGGLVVGVVVDPAEGDAPELDALEGPDAVGGEVVSAMMISVAEKAGVVGPAHHASSHPSRGR